MGSRQNAHDDVNETCCCVCEIQMWNIYNVRQSVYSIERLERAVNSVHIADDIVVCSTRNDIGQTFKLTSE